MDKLLVIGEDGNVTSLYSDDLPDLGSQKVTRASNVEPDPEGGWTVTLTDDPRNGAYRGRVIARCIARRADALAIEVKFIQRHILGARAQAQDGPVHISKLIEPLLAEMLTEMLERRKANGSSEE